MKEESGCGRFVVSVITFILMLRMVGEVSKDEFVKDEFL